MIAQVMTALCVYASLYAEDCYGFPHCREIQQAHISPR